MSEIPAKRFSWIDFHLFPIFIYWLLRDVTAPGTTRTLYFERVTDLIRDKLGVYKKIIFNPGFEVTILFYPSTLDCNSVVNKRTVCMNPVFIF